MLGREGPEGTSGGKGSRGWRTGSLRESQGTREAVHSDKKRQRGGMETGK